MNMKKRLSPVLIVAGIINLILFFTKYYIGVHTNSLCIYTDSINNLMDTLALCLALVGISYINKPATEHFKFGFGKMEHITTFVMSLIMTVAGCSFAYNSLSRLMTPVPVWYFAKYAVIIVLTCLVKLFLGVIFTFRYKKTRSAVLKTVMLDSYLDCAITLMTLISFTLSNTVGFAFDSVLGLGISIVIAVLGIRLIISSLSDLIGQRNEEAEKKISFLINKINEDIVINDISIHSYGDEKLYVTLNLSLTDRDIDILSVQNIIKNQLKAELNFNSTVEWEVFS
jgi:cation diffusion facilitator family transporter